MNKTNLINTYYNKDSIIKMTTSYVLYYQISLGAFAFETIQDPDETIAKLQELNLTLNPNTVLLSVLDIFHNLDNDDYKTINQDFDSLLQQTAILHALKDFVNNDAELLNKDSFLYSKETSIFENSFFDSKMKIQYLSEYQNMNQHYSSVITDEYAHEAKKIIETNFI